MLLGHRFGGIGPRGVFGGAQACEQVLELAQRIALKFRFWLGGEQVSLGAESDHNPL